MAYFLRCTLSLLILQVSIRTGYAQETLTLEQCIAEALEQHIDVLRNRLQTEAEAIGLRQKKQNLLPSLDADLAHGYSAGRSINPTTNEYEERSFISGRQQLSSALVLFDGLRMFHDITQQVHAYQVARLDEQAVREQVALNVTEAYISALTARDMVSQADSQARVTAAQVERATLLHEEGDISPGDYFDLKGQYASDLNNLNQARNTWREALINLFNLMNRPFHEQVALAPLMERPIETAGLSHEQVYESAVGRLSTVKAADHLVKQATLNLKAARAAYFPTLSAGAGLSSNYAKGGEGTYYEQMQNNLSRSLNFSLQIPLFSRFAVRNQVARAKLALREAEKIAETRRNELQQAVNRALYNLEAAETQYRNLQEQVAHYTQSFRVAQVRFESGVTTSVEYLIAKNKLDNANANLVIAKYQWHLRKRIVDYYRGELTFE